MGDGRTSRRQIVHGGVHTMPSIRAVALPAFLALALSSCARVPGALLESGQRVRVQVRDVEPPRYTGTVIELTVDSLALAMEKGAPDGVDGPRIAVPVAAIRRVEISTGVHPQTLDGLHRGGQVGLIVVLLGTLAGEWVAGDDESIGAFVGCTVTGGVIGTFVRRENWRRLPLRCVHLSLGPLPARGFGVGVSVVLWR